MVLCVWRGWQGQKQSLDQEPGLAEAPHPGTGTGPTMEAEFSPEATQPPVMLMTSRCLGEGLGSLLSCQGCREPGRPLGVLLLHPLSQLRCPSASVFHLTQLRCVGADRGREVHNKDQDQSSLCSSRSSMGSAA